MPPPRSEKSEIARRWPILLGCTFGLAFGITGHLPYAAGFLAKSISADTGWTLTQQTTANLVTTVGTVFAAQFWGAAVDRVGALRVLGAGYCLAVVGLSAISLVPLHFTAYVSLLALTTWLGTATAIVAFLPIIRETFDKQRGLAFGILIAGNGVMGLVVPLAISALIALGGWRAGYRALAVLTGAGGLIAFATFYLAGLTQRPRAVAQARPASATYAAVLTDPITWRLLVIFLLITLAINGYLFHLAALLTSRGLSLTSAALMQSSFAIGIVIIRLGMGFLMDRFFVPRLTAALVGVAMGGILLLVAFPHSLIVTPVGLLMLAAIFGAEGDVMSYLASRYYDKAVFGKAYALIWGLGVLGTGSAPVWLSLASRNGMSYGQPLWISLCLLLVALPLLLTTPGYRDGTGH